MSADSPMRIRGIYRSPSHLPIWAVLQGAGIWGDVGLELTSFEYVDDSTIAEGMLLEGEVDFISGNHISTYTLFARGAPIVHLTSPSNSVHDALVMRQPISSIAELQGKRIGETAITGPDGGYAHNRGNHLLTLKRDGVQPDEVTWVELAPKMSDEFRHAQRSALEDGLIDATFVSGSGSEYEAAGFHVTRPERLPMINGPTITCSSDTLRKRQGLGEQLVKAEVLGIHFAHAHPEETDRILADLTKREDASRPYARERILRMPRKPYPELEALANAYELACIQRPETRQISPVSLWDLHYLRELDDSGFIDALYA
jgi:ABC-type nitrate/sulfonate/bicarbonate transport system substrate-binding protein